MLQAHLGQTAAAGLAQAKRTHGSREAALGARVVPFRTQFLARALHTTLHDAVWECRDLLDAPAETDAGSHDLWAEPVAEPAFLPYGRVVRATEDGTPAGVVDRALDLSGGRPRFYIMALRHRGYRMDRITRHRGVTQVLASANARPWLLAVAPPSPASDMPDLAQLRAFSIPGETAVLLHRGTWHAGPFFHDAEMRFFNLEAEDTNVVDHGDARLSVAFRLREASPP